MQGKLISLNSPSPKLVQRAAGRDAVLWVGAGLPTDAATIQSIADLVRLPWKAVLIETSSESLIKAIEGASESDAGLVQARGFPHLIAMDPGRLTLPERSLPIFLLNGRDGGIGDESSHIGPRAKRLRRDNQIASMVAMSPTEIVLLCFGEDEPLATLSELWAEGFRALISVVSHFDRDRQAIVDWLGTSAHPSAVDLYDIGTSDFVDALVSKARVSLAPDEIVIRVRDEAGTRDIDITGCELAEQPILDHYDIIRTKDLVPLQPEELKTSEIASFFDRSSQSWRPYAAGLPWSREKNQAPPVLRALGEVHMRGSEANRVFAIASEPGAGGTTLARTIAFEVANAGYPVLVASNISFQPSATEVESFLLRVHRSTYSAQEQEIPWLIVFDAAHWAGRESELQGFVRHLGRRGRPAVAVAVTSDALPDELENSARTSLLATLRHEMSRDEVLRLGEHLNRYLKPHGRMKTPEQWLEFWEQHRPQIDTPISSFWIALEFWLKGLLNLGESIQQWIYRQFVALRVTDETRRLILQIAALAVERTPLPEGLMPRARDLEYPYSVILETVRADAPALGLIRERAGMSRRWSFAHTQLGRYLLNSAYFDRTLCARLSMAAAQNPTHLRLLLLQDLIKRPELSQSEYRGLALEFAVRIFKLDLGQAVEYFPLWREVFMALNSVPRLIRETSRTFLHHMAISCRRVATTTTHFDATDDEREQLLQSAIGLLYIAIENISKREDDEGDLNLYNSLALACQNLADLRERLGRTEDEVKSLRAQATAATLRAQEEDPLNPYVLETTARNLLQTAASDSARRVELASRALNYIHEALVRDRSQRRLVQLSHLLSRAVDLLREEGRAALERLGNKGDSVAFVALAWLELSSSLPKHGRLFNVTEESARRALAVLERNKGPRSWLWLKLRYDLIAVASPSDFDTQLLLLEELEGSEFNTPLQYQAERAVLLYQVGRPYDGEKLFASLRQAIRSVDASVEIPPRMRWLLRKGGRERQLCDAQAVDSVGFRQRARVADLSGAVIPFIPQEFGRERMQIGQRFKVEISFGPMGPFAKPPHSDDVG